jgi:hypothetical protein
MKMFAVVALTFVILIQSFLFKEFSTYIKTTRFSQYHRFVLPVFIIFNLPMLLIFSMKILRIEMHSIISVLLYPFAIWQGGTFFIFLVIMSGKLISLPFKVFNKIKMSMFSKNQKGIKVDESRRRFLRTALFGISAYAFAGATIGAISKDDYVIENIKIKLKKLPVSLKGLTIGLISDIHSGIFMSRDEMDEYVNILNSFNADLIFIPGDFITSEVDEIFPFVESFSKLQARYGIFATLGNHEFFRGEADRIAKEIEKIGIRVLRNQNEIVEINGEKIFIIGIDDLRYGADMDKAMRGVNRNLVKILLSHKPYAFPDFARYGIDLTVSGHTHGGQIVLAKIQDTYIAPASLVSKYVAGYYRLGNSHLYVSRGVGVVGLPIRLNCPPEITRIILA